MEIRCPACQFNQSIEGIGERTEHLDIFFPPVTQWCSISDVVFTGGRGLSDCKIIVF